MKVTCYFGTFRVHKAVLGELVDAIALVACWSYILINGFRDQLLSAMMMCNKKYPQCDIYVKEIGGNSFLSFFVCIM